jgi:hypothetical protein
VVTQQEGFLNVFLHDLGLCLGILGERLELLQAVVDAVDAEATSIVAGLHDPDIPCAICGILREQSLHFLVIFDYLTDQKHRRALPAWVACDISILLSL